MMECLFGSLSTTNYIQIGFLIGVLSVGFGVTVLIWIIRRG